jgi:C1A family cysteine protease
MSRIYNLLPDKKINDSTYQNGLKLKYQSFSVSDLPSKVDLRSYSGAQGTLAPVVDQGSLGSCVACAVATAFQFCDQNWSPSKLFIYYNCRLLDGNVNSDSGTTISQSMFSLYKYGACSELNWPYLIPKWNLQPGVNCYQEGLEHQTIDYYNISQTYLQLKACIASGYPFVFGFWVYESFESSQTTLTGVMSMPESNQRMLGGHSVICVGYDDERRVWICQNSWGSSWGDRGFFYMPYEYLDDSRNLATDIWKIVKVEKSSDYTPPTPEEIADVIPIVNNDVPIVPIDIKLRFKIIPKLKTQITSEDKLFSDIQNKKKLLTNILT